MTELKQIIEEAFEHRSAIDSTTASAELREAVEETLSLLELGRVRVAEPSKGGWVVNTWLKKAVLLCFRLNENTIIRDGYTNYFDKVPPKYAEYGENDFLAAGVRVVPPAAARRGSHVASGVVLMPSYVNIGAYVDSGTMVDTWATVGSCAQIGRNVHLSGGVGIGGVLEPLQASPTIIEDDCFIGARSEVVEGDRRARLGHFDGRLSGPEHQDLQPDDGRGQLRPHPGRLGGGARRAARPRWQPQPVLRHHH